MRTTDSTTLARLGTARGFLALALPLAAGAGVNWAMQFTNRLFLAYLSPDALAASLPAGMMVYSIQSLFTASAAYVGAFAAQHVGAGEDEEAGAMAWPMLWLVLSGGALAAALIPARGPLFGVFGAEPAVTADMAALGAWYLADTVPMALLGGLCGWFGGLGWTRLVLALSLGVCVLSVLLNHWLIFGGLGVPALGIHGAGLAGLSASSLGAAIAVAVFLAPAQRARFATWRRRNADPRRLRRFCVAALPRGATEVLEMAAMLLFTAAVARLGTAELAANNLVFSLYLTVLIPLLGLGQGITIGVGQAVGAGRIDLARAVVRNAGWVVATVLALAMLLFAFAPDLLMSAYVADDPADPAASAARWDAILAHARPLMLLCLPMMLGDGSHIVWRFAVQGAGDTRWPLVALTTSAFVAFALPSWALIRLVPAERWSSWGLSPLTACWVVFAVYVLVIAALMAWRYLRGPWQGMSLRR